MLPERINKSLAKKFSGHLYDDDKFNAAAAEDGTISREDYLQRKHES